MSSSVTYGHFFFIRTSQICPHLSKPFRHHPVLCPSLLGAVEEKKRQEKAPPALGGCLLRCTQGSKQKRSVLTTGYVPGAVGAGDRVGHRGRGRLPGAGGWGALSEMPGGGTGAGCPGRGTALWLRWAEGQCRPSLGVGRCRPRSSLTWPAARVRRRWIQIRQRNTHLGIFLKGTESKSDVSRRLCHHRALGEMSSGPHGDANPLEAGGSRSGPGQGSVSLIGHLCQLHGAEGTARPPCPTEGWPAKQWTVLTSKVRAVSLRREAGPRASLPRPPLPGSRDSAPLFPSPSPGSQQGHGPEA